MGLVSTIQQVMQQKPRQLILTGGDAPLFAQFLTEFNPIIKPDLLLSGLQFYIEQQEFESSK